jgi:hypothetical protein
MKTNLSRNRAKHYEFLKHHLKEDFLQFLWKFKLFELNTLNTICNTPITIINGGVQNHQSGPDFLNGMLKIGSQVWAGNIEVHLKSSYWYAHGHDKDCNFDSIILHVVWEYDMPIYDPSQNEVPTLELNEYVNISVLESYYRLFSKSKKWILCEGLVGSVDAFIVRSWLHRLYFERLERKANFIFELLKATQNDWEAVLFQLLARSFGMKLNADAFFNMATSFEYSIVRKCRSKKGLLEILLFGQAGFFNKKINENLYKRLKHEYEYLKNKFKLTEVFSGEFLFFRLRPNNFPTIRISQFASLYEQQQNLFSKVLRFNTLREFYTLFDVQASQYWNTHYVFGKVSKFKIKQISKSFIDLLLVNVIVPLKYAYGKSHNSVNFTNRLESFIDAVKYEKNSIVSCYIDRGIAVPTALEAQGLLELKNEYCDKKKCLRCAIGVAVLKCK